MGTHIIEMFIVIIEMFKTLRCTSGHSQPSPSKSLTVLMPRLKDLGATKYFIIDAWDKCGNM